MAKKKFDTNPLDPEFPEKIKEAETQALPKDDYKTVVFPSPVTEDETRRFQEADFNAYQSPYIGQNVPVGAKTTPLYSPPTENISRKVDKIGLPENILTALPYIPFSVGLVAGLIILFIVPRSETKVRFHAAQGLAAHLAILLVSAVLHGIGKITDIADLGNFIFQIVTTVMLIIFTIKAWQGKPVHIEAVDDLTNWIEEKSEKLKFSGKE
jgi:Chloroplast import component protein (Tic20).